MAYVIERLFWASRGITVQEVVWIEIIYSLVIILLELPTGMFADRLSRKTFIVIDALLALVEILILIFATNFFWHFVLAIVLSAIGHALQSGAHNGLIYDTLRARHETNKFEKVLGRIKAIDYLGIMISGFLGAIVATEFQYVTTYWISFISLFIALIIAITLKDVQKSQQKSGSLTWSIQDWAEVSKFMLRKAHIRYITLIGIISGGVLIYLEEFWQIYMQAIHIPISYFGMINMIGFGAVAVGSMLATPIKERLGFQRIIQLATTICTVGFLWLALQHHIHSIFAMVCIYFAAAILEPLIYGYLHDHAIEKYRATIESAYSLLGRLAVALIGLPFGYLTTHYTIFVGFMYLALVLSVLKKILVLIIGKKLITHTENEIKHI